MKMTASKIQNSNCGYASPLRMYRALAIIKKQRIKKSFQTEKESSPHCYSYEFKK